MNFYRYSRPAIFLPGDARRTPAYARRAAARPDCRRTSDPLAPYFVRSSWRRSEACLHYWRVGAWSGSPLYQKLYFKASYACKRVLRSIEQAALAARRVAMQARESLIQKVFAG